jgi:Kef-type K+ transport system membrane component KefB
MNEAAAGSDIAAVLLALAVILFAAKLGGELFERYGQSAVLGELLMGAVIGNLHLLGIGGLTFLSHNAVLDVLAQIGIILLLFEVGIASTLPQMLRVGASSSLVAVIGVIVPSVLGFGASRVFFPALSPYAHLFVGTILAATSVGVTTRVLRDLNKSETPEARIILGAAVIDDVLGLIVLAVVVALIRATDAGTSLGFTDVALISAKAVGFLLVAIPAGMWIAPRVFALATHLKSGNVLLPMSLTFCFALAWASSVAGLAPIVGAFAAGLILEDVHLEQLRVRERQSLTELLRPVSTLFLPVFFFLMGLKVDATAFADSRMLLFAAVLTVVAVTGKLVAGWGVVQSGVDRVLVGIGMIPRGEVGFVFAGIGTTLTLSGQPLVSPAIYSAVVLTIMATTLVTPLLLSARLRRQSRFAA